MRYGRRILVGSAAAPSKPVTALAVMLAILAVPYLPVPGETWRSLRVVRAPWDKASAAENEVPGADRESAPPVPVAEATPTVGEQALKATENEGTITNALPATPAAPVAPDPPAAMTKDAGAAGAVVAEQPIEDETGEAMRAFYTSLAATDAKTEGAVTRVLHYGDSVITADFISGTVRRKMQARFGDAGHGFILIANPWEWYFHNDVSHSASEGWSAQRITGPFTKDGFYGLGGVSFHGSGGQWATFGTASTGDFGKKVSRFDIYYLEKPNGGDLETKVKGGAVETFSTRATGGDAGDAVAARIHSVTVPDGEASLTLRPTGNGDVRLFGVELERDVPGVVYSALGANGARVKLLAQMNPAHWKEQMDLARPALVVLQYGTNESEDGAFKAETYEKALGGIVDTVKAAAPNASVLLCAPLDRAEKNDDGALVSKPVIARLVASQRAVAKAHGVAFWDTYAAMGGDGAMSKWVKATPQLGSWDLTHPTPAGAELIGGMLTKAFLAGYQASKGAAAK
jgi:lysophospholipase L1-like esterase